MTDETVKLAAEAYLATLPSGKLGTYSEFCIRVFGPPPEGKHVGFTYRGDGTDHWNPFSDEFSQTRRAFQALKAEGIAVYSHALGWRLAT